MAPTDIFNLNITRCCRPSNVLGRAECQRHDRHGWLPAARRHHAAAVADEQILDFVTAVVAIYNRRARVISHTARSQ